MTEIKVTIYGTIVSAQVSYNFILVISVQ